jgi:hypothetical protein
MTGERVRLTDIFTNAAAIADYTGDSEVRPAHLLEAIDHLRAGEPWKLGEDARPHSPLGRAGRRAAVSAALREIAQAWFVRLGNDPLAELDGAALAEFVSAIREVGD